MLNLKRSLSVLLLLSSVQNVRLIRNDNLNRSAEILFNLTSLAITESRQNFHGSGQAHNEVLVQNLGGPVQNYKYGEKLRYPQHSQYLPHYNNYKPYSPYPQYFPTTSQNYQHTIMGILHSIARNDKLQCVPRMICEMASQTSSGSRQGITLPSLPFTVDMESIIGLLSASSIFTDSPLPMLAKAALLGYTSKQNSDSCVTSYPMCPRDPDKLIEYLNNYNGGFFRFFEGINPQPQLQNYLAPNTQHGGLYNNHNGNINYYRYGNAAEKRIQTKPAQYVQKYGDTQNFPASKILVFPPDNQVEDGDTFSFRKPKELPHSIEYYYHSNELFNFQKPLPNHKATPMIFPDRTGTGELRIDAENLSEQNYYHDAAANADFYYRPSENYADSNRISRGLFSFPA